MRSTSSVRSWSATCVGLLYLVASSAFAQPTNFAEVSAFEVPSNPPSTLEYIQIPSDLFDFGGQDTPGEVFSVKWLKFTLNAPVTGDLFLDLDSRIYSVTPTQGDLFFALFDNNGAPLASDDADGSFPEGLSAGLSFGSTNFRSPTRTPLLLGQDGTLGAGTYWLAIVAGPGSSVTMGPGAWDISTSTSYQLGFFQPDTYYVEINMIFGNTTPLPPPTNDSCSSPIAITEGAIAWSGSNAGATSDGVFACYPPRDPAYAPRDIWFSYTPSRNGMVEVIASGGAGGAATPILGRFDGGCGSVSTQCVGGGSFSSSLDSERILFEVSQGVPVLLGLAVRGGQTGPMQLSVQLVPPPCVLDIPSNAVFENEACGVDLNGGCNIPVPTYEPLALGTPVHGLLYNASTIRDTDWFEFQVAEQSLVTLNFSAQYLTDLAIFPAALPGESCWPLDAPLLSRSIDSYDLLCTTISGDVELAPGTYRLAIAHRYFDGILCGIGYERYWINLDSTPTTPPCPSDFNRDGAVDSDDVIGFFAAWDVSNPLADFTRDGGVDSDDIIEFFAAWDSGC